MTASGVRPQALVTGATGGMGGEIVRELSRTHDVIAVGRSADALSELARQTGATPWVLDITDAEALAARTAELTRLDVLVHGAAIAAVHTTETARPEDWERQFAINVFAPAELTRQVLPLLRESRGTVVFIGSGAGTRPVPGHAIYTASKHALRGFADVLRIDEQRHRVRVVTLAPGQTGRNGHPVRARALHQAVVGRGDGPVPRGCLPRRPPHRHRRAPSGRDRAPLTSPARREEVANSSPAGQIAVRLCAASGACRRSH